MRVPRLTTRRWLAIVAIIAVGLGLGGRLIRLRADYERRAIDHLERWMVLAEAESPGPRERAEHHFRLSWKYRWAAQRPWLPVAQDPPEPE